MRKPCSQCIPKSWVLERNSYSGDKRGKIVAYFAKYSKRIIGVRPLLMVSPLSLTFFHASRGRRVWGHVCHRTSCRVGRKALSFMKSLSYKHTLAIPRKRIRKDCRTCRHVNLSSMRLVRRILAFDFCSLQTIPLFRILRLLCKPQLARMINPAQ